MPCKPDLWQAVAASAMDTVSDGDRLTHESTTF
jgi:hypothetical protein